MTPAIAAAAVVSTDAIVPLATSLRAKAAWSVPGTEMSSTKRPRPVRKRTSS